MPTLPDGLLPRLIAEVAARADRVDAWSAAAEVLRLQPPQIIGALAQKMLIDSYFRLVETTDGDREVMTMPLRETVKRRKPTASRPASDSSFDLIGALKKAIDTFERELKAEWTAEMLASTFVGAEGRIVTFADATVEDHRAAMADAELTVAVAGLKHSTHVKAITDIEAARVESLGQLVDVAA